jgi:DNA processing protein
MSSELTERQAFLVLNALPNIGPITLNRLLEELGDDPRDVLAADRRRLESVRGVGPVISASIGAWREQFVVAREEARMATAATDFITTRDAGYPRLLKEINDPPIGLYRKGRYDFAQPNIAIIGSRRTTLYGQAMAKKFGAELARLGFCVTSGLARGIDTAAHEGALSVGGKTAAVLGTASTSSIRRRIWICIAGSRPRAGRLCRSFRWDGARTGSRSRCATASSRA